MRKIIQVLVVTIISSGCNNSQSNKYSNSDKLGLDTVANTYSVTTEDVSMNAAITKAKQTIEEFDQALNSDSAYTNFAVKKRFKTSNDNGEHMWINVISLTNGNYRGVVNNDPEMTTEVKYGDTVIVQKDEVTDWMYLDKDVLRGGYTIRVIRDKLNKEEQAKMDAEMGFKIED